MKTVLKILKTVAKVIGGIIGSVLGILAVLSLITLSWGLVQRGRGTVTDTLPQTPDDFTPVLRFAVYTDVHCENENVDDAFETLYRIYDADEKYKGIDAIIGLGDFSAVGMPEHYVEYVDTVKKYEREGTKIINILGNHEMKQKQAPDYFREYFGYEPDNAFEINGYQFITFSGEPWLTEWTFSPSSVKWLKNALAEAEEKSDGKPIFTFQHPHNFGTVYGSAVWCDPQLNTVWAGHSNVINFSGHSHFPMNDPRSINQSTYTSIGVGAMARFELDKNYIVGQHPDGYEDAAELCVVEADAQGRVRIIGYDLLSDTVFCEYFLEDVSSKDNFAYTYKNMKAHDTAPVFPENTGAGAERNENGEWVLSFNEAKSDFIVHHYNVKIYDENGKKIFSDTFVDDYYVIDEDDTADFRLPSDTLESAKSYTAVITAVSAYHLKSDAISLTFTAE